MRNEGRSRSTKRNSLRGSDISFLQREMHGRVPFAPATISKPPKAALNSAGVSRNNLYLSYASADPATAAGQLSHLRHGPGTADSGAGRTGNSRACLEHAGGLMGGRAFFQARRAIDTQSQPQYVDIDRVRRGSRLRIQCCRHAGATVVPFRLPGKWPRRRLFRSGGGHCLADADGANPGVESQVTNLDGYQGAARIVA